MALVLYEKLSAHAAQITFNRPDVHNALNFEAIDQFSAAVEAAHNDLDLGALLLTGAGRRAFCAGGDLKELSEYQTEEDGQQVSAGMTAALLRLESLPVPTLAVVNGLARGGGGEISLACDLRWISSTASWGFTQIGLALTPGWGSGQRLLRTVGYSRALSWLVEGRVLSADEAFAEGVMDRLLPPDQLKSAAREWAVQVSSKPREVLRGIKTLLRAGLTMTLDEARKIEADIFPSLWASQPHHEAVSRFINRIRP